MNKLTRLAAGLCLAGIADAQAADPKLRNDIAADYREHLATLFEHFHRNPELSGKEIETSKRLAAEIRAGGAVGIMFHHALMDAEERRAAAELFALLAVHPQADCRPMLAIARELGAPV